MELDSNQATERTTGSTTKMKVDMKKHLTAVGLALAVLMVIWRAAADQ